MHLPVLVIGVFLFATTGYSRASDASKIYLGREIVPHSRPWLGWLRIGVRRVKCGCALISPTEVLTAASCVQQPIISITLGDHDRTVDEGTEQVFSVSQITQHPNFNFTHRNFESDLAVIELDGVANTSGDAVSIIPLLPFDQLTSRIYMKHTRVAGWGHVVLSDGNDINDQSIVPLEYTADVANTSVCDALEVPSDSICFLPFRDPNSVVCEGDVGGPLTIKRKQIWNLAGVISGFDSLSGCSSGEKSAVKTTSYLQWISSVMKVVKPSPLNN